MDLDAFPAETTSQVHLDRMTIDVSVGPNFWPQAGSDLQAELFQSRSTLLQAGSPDGVQEAGDPKADDSGKHSDQDPRSQDQVEEWRYPSRSTLPPSWARVTVGAVFPAQLAAKASRASSSASGAWWNKARCRAPEIWQRRWAYSGYECPHVIFSKY